MSSFILISIKPEFSAKIISGEKTIELRKSAPKIDYKSRVIIYSTYPEKAVIGYCKIKEVIRMSPQDMWENHSVRLGIDKRRFDEYYQNCNMAIGLKLTEVIKLDLSISLDNIKKHVPVFHPPQTFQYLSSEQVLNVYSKLAS
ncbi:MAG: ASCH domain-containing protein [Balneolales bacterium]|nr:ASCH domain-containing protein [Balneolales bacterium]